MIHSIEINHIGLSNIPYKDQTVVISYRLTSDPDVPASYKLVKDNVKVKPDGSLELPVWIGFLAEDTEYVVWTLCKCSNTSIFKTFRTGGSTVPSMPCASNTSYAGAEGYPNVLRIDLGTAAGRAYFNYNALDIPDRFVIKKIDGTVLADTGWRGAKGSYQEQLTNWVNTNGGGDSEIVGTGIGSLYFEKTTDYRYVDVEVYSPLAGTGWSCNLGCPGGQVWTTEKADNFYRQCGEGGNPQAYVFRKTYSSNISSDDLDYQVASDASKYSAEGQDRANQNGICQYYFARRQDVQKNDCVAPNVGSIESFGLGYYSNISLQDAQNIAYADPDWDTKAQAYANSWGSCKAPLAADAVGIVVVDFQSDVNMRLAGFVGTSGVAPYNQVVSPGNNFYPNDGTPAENCWALASDLWQTNPIQRFEFNVARLLNTYPGVPSFDFYITGRSANAGMINLACSLKGADAGNMTMGGTPGSYRPSTQSSNSIGLTNYQTWIQSGADGTYGTDEPVVLKISYTVATKSISVTVTPTP